MPGGKRPRIKGYEFEQRVKKDLEKKGFFVVRQGRSKFPDLLAVKKGELATKIKDFSFVYETIVYFIECKCNKYISRRERSELHFFAVKHGIRPLIAYKDSKRHVCFCEIDKYYEAGL